MAHKEPTKQDGKPTVEQVEAKLLAERVAELFSPKPWKHGSEPICNDGVYTNLNCLAKEGVEYERPTLH